MGQGYLCLGLSALFFNARVDLCMFPSLGYDSLSQVDFVV